MIEWFFVGAPLKLLRHVRGTMFYHKGPLPTVPRAVHQLKITKRSGGEGTRLWIEDLEGLLGLTQIDAVELHPWNATIDDIEQADTMVIDLDPGPGIEWSFLVDAALTLRELLYRQGYDCWPKLTGQGRSCNDSTAHSALARCGSSTKSRDRRTPLPASIRIASHCRPPSTRGADACSSTTYEMGAGPRRSALSRRVQNPRTPSPPPRRGRRSRPAFGPTALP